MNFFDILKQKLEAKGLPVVEQLAEKAYEAVKETALEYAAAHPNNLVRALVPTGVAAIDGMVNDVINKIDGQPG